MGRGKAGKTIGGFELAAAFPVKLTATSSTRADTVE
jgi:hypothetical protein